MTLLRIFILALLLTVVAALFSVLLLRATAAFIGEPFLYNDCMEDVAGSLRDSGRFLDGLLGGQGG